MANSKSMNTESNREDRDPSITGMAAEASGRRPAGEGDRRPSADAYRRPNTDEETSRRRDRAALMRDKNRLGRIGRR